jgi:hypothetical protein
MSGTARGLAATALLLLAGVDARAADDVGTLLERMRAALMPPTRMQSAFVMEVEDDEGNTVRWAGRLERDGHAPSVRMTFESPPDLRGVVYTATGARNGLDSATIYLPFVRRTRTIQRDFRGVPFLGSDFNYEDLGLEQLNFRAHALAGDGEVGGRPCRRIESRPAESWWYGRIVRCIDAEDHLPRRTEYFDPAGLPYKVRTLEDVRTIDGHPTALRIRMRVVPDESESTLALSEVEYGSAR